MLGSTVESKTQPADVGGGARIRPLLLVAVIGSVLTTAAVPLRWCDTVTGCRTEFGPLYVLCCISIVAGAVVARTHASRSTIPMYLSAVVGVPAGILFVTALKSLIDAGSTIHVGLWLFLVAAFVTVTAVLTTLPLLLKRRPGPPR